MKWGLVMSKSLIILTVRVLLFSKESRISCSYEAY